MPQPHPHSLCADHYPGDVETTTQTRITIETMSTTQRTSLEEARTVAGEEPDRLVDEQGLEPEARRDQEDVDDADTADDSWMLADAMGSGEGTPLGLRKLNASSTLAALRSVF